MLMSSLFGGRAVLQSMAQGARMPPGDCGIDVARTVQQALLALGMQLPQLDFDDPLDDDTQRTIGQYRASRDLPGGQVIDAHLIRRLDLELSFLEGACSTDLTHVLPNDRHLMRLDPYLAAVTARRLDLPQFDRGMLEKLRRDMELSNRLCLRLSLDLGPKISAWFAEAVAEPRIFADFVKVNGPAIGVFFDKSKSYEQYRSFVITHNQSSFALERLLEIAGRSRPDILSHRPPDFSWYEIKPMSVSGMKESLEKMVKLLTLYLPLPYRPGRRYNPTRRIEVDTFFADTGERIAVYLEVERTAPGLIFWALCLEGDVIEYFNRFKIVAGLLQILLALCLLLPAEGVAAGIAAEAAAVIRLIAAGTGLTLVALHKQQ